MASRRIRTWSRAAGIEDVAACVEAEMDQYIDGPNNLPPWRGETEQSARNQLFHYYESRLTAMRMGPWKFDFSTTEDYRANLVPRTVPLVFNIRMDPFESYDTTEAYGHLMQKVSWLIQPMSVLMQQHLATLAEYPPVQGGTSFDMSNIVEDFMRKGMQQRSRW
jgi:arylsulfatase